MDQLGWKWALEKDLTKMLRTPFGLDLLADDIDSFLLQKIQKKLTY
jgi:hypothetical protein